MLAPVEMDPIERQWFDLYIMRACCDAAAGRRVQFLQEHPQAVMYTAPIPGA